ncbi:MAG: nucleotidyltransferase family protein [Bacteroidales bacterium]
MKAMIFSAGLGSRLRPLTNNKPKALVELNGEPLILGVIKKLKEAGVTEIVVNLHHFANELRTYLTENEFGIQIYFSDESNFLQETGGGLKKAASYFQDAQAFFAYNVDILSNIDLNKLYQQHCENKSIATLAVRNRKSSRYLLFDKDNNLSGWENIVSNEVRLTKGKREDLLPFAFSGIQVIDPEIFKLIAEVGRFSIIDVYLRIANSEILKAYVHDKDYWFDLGTLKQLEEASEFLKDINIGLK